MGVVLFHVVWSTIQIGFLSFGGGWIPVGYVMQMGWPWIGTSVWVDQFLLEVVCVN